MKLHHLIDRKQLRFTVDALVYAEMRIVAMRNRISLDAIMQEFAAQLVKGEPAAMGVLDAALTKKVYKDLRRPGPRVAVGVSDAHDELSPSDVEAIYNMLDMQKNDEGDGR